MKIILIALTCLMFSTVNAFSEERIIPPTSPDMVKVQRKLPGSIAGNLPPEFSKGVITPDRIKDFLAKPQSGKDNYIILNFDNADLKDVINTIGSITNENFILSPGVSARITIHSAKKIRVSEVMNVFESVLEVNGMSLVRSGEFLKVVTAAAAKQKPLEVRMGDDESQVPDIDRPVTQIVPVKYVPVAEVSAVLTPMLSQFGSIIPNARNNLLIINDLSSSIIRLLKILKEIDVNAFQNTRMLFFKPKYSDVQTLSRELLEVLNALKLTGDGIALVPIERINSLVVFSSSPTLLRTVKGWMRKLDEEVMTGQNVFVYPVQNVEAKTIADILKSIYNSGSSGALLARTTATTTKKRTNKRITMPSSSQASGSRIEIIPFEPTNSLVILAPPGIYREMVETIKRIDIYPREVLIEAIIAEVTLSDSEKLGIQWSVLNNITLGNKEYVNRAQNVSGLTGFPTLSASSPALAESTAGLSFVLFRSDKLASMISALSSESEVNILSSPRLLVRDRQEAYIEVGSEVPIATSTTATSTGSDTLTQNIEYRTVGIKLKIKPTINEERTVVLDVEQEVSSIVDDNVTVGAAGTTYPSFNTTKAKTSVVVPDKQGIVIGGIMKQRESDGYQGVPFLSSIPFFGNLFKYTVKTKSKTELIIIINPHVVTTKTEADRLTTQFMSKLKNIKKLLRENEDKISLPNLDEKDPAKTDEP